jgi:hypothetical protein
MTRLEKVEKAVLALSAEDRAKFRAWYEAQMFDDQIERDIKAGKLDKLADEALAEHKACRSREL